MGYYVNPPDQSKESFLQRKGIVASSRRISWNDVPTGFLPVALVNNSFFIAAAICYSERELDEFMDPSDDRPKEFYFVRITELLPVADDDFRKYAQSQGWEGVEASAEVTA